MGASAPRTPMLAGDVWWWKTPATYSTSLPGQTLPYRRRSLSTHLEIALQYSPFLLHTLNKMKPGATPRSRAKAKGTAASDLESSPVPTPMVQRLPWAIWFSLLASVFLIPCTLKKLASVPSRSRCLSPARSLTERRFPCPWPWES